VLYTTEQTNASEENPMSISMYRNNVTRLTKEIADLRKQVGQENERMARLGNDTVSIQRTMTGNMNLSTLNSKLQQIANKQKDISQCQKKVGDLESRISSKMSDLSRALDSLRSLESQEQRKQDAEDKRRRDEEKKRNDEQKRRDDEALRRAKELTRETEKQARLHSQLRSSPLIIDFSKLPTKIKVVFFAANPIDQDQLRLDEEIRTIEEKIRASEYRDSVQLISKWAVRPTDLLQALNEHRPNVVHFSGHGSATDEIVFVDSNGNTKLVSKNAIVELMNTMADNIQVVIFNTCFSSGQAEAVTQHIDVAIGMNTSIGDEAARVFAASFYSAIGFGRSVLQAFDQAKAALMLEGIPEERTPVLFTRDGVDPMSIVLVRPT
jgi:hypothetical protein